MRSLILAGLLAFAPGPLAAQSDQAAHSQGYAQPQAQWQSYGQATVGGRGGGQAYNPYAGQSAQPSVTARQQRALARTYQARAYVPQGVQTVGYGSWAGQTQTQQWAAQGWQQPGFQQQPQQPQWYDPWGAFSRPTVTIRPRQDAKPSDDAGAGVGGPARSFCVRLCDGRFFPVVSNSSLNETKMCASFCPATKTKVFEGSTIEEARAQDGQRYSALPNALLYRKEVVEGCTCDGKSPLGLAKIDVAKDPTLRAGDIVATQDGMKVFRGASGLSHKTSDFTPIDRSRMVGSDIRRRLQNVKIAKDAKASPAGL